MIKNSKNLRTGSNNKTIAKTIGLAFFRYNEAPVAPYEHNHVLIQTSFVFLWKLYLKSTS